MKTFYPHRHNPDGSWDSICPRCFATVATVSAERQLLQCEMQHVCERMLALGNDGEEEQRKSA